jgi:hypothetical protein
VATAQAKLDSDPATARQQIAAAKADVVSGFGGVLNPLVQARLDSVSTYATAIGVLQKASSPPPTEPAAAKPSASSQTGPKQAPAPPLAGSSGTSASPESTQ